jgi:NADH-quinone oxidoreductase subunit J
MSDYGLSSSTFFALALGGLGIYLLLPRGPASESRVSRWLGGALATLSLVWVTAEFGARLPGLSNSLVFYILAALSVGSAAMTISSRNPVFSALWFALMLFSNSGLYLLQDAEFLAAATVIIYAGAIIVTFLFVIMLAQPRGTATYDRYSREPFFSCLAGVILAGTLIGTLHYSMISESQPSARGGLEPALPSPAIVQEVLKRGSPTSRMPEELAADETEAADVQLRPGHVKSLGQTLFLDHYVSVEVIGVLLLVAVIGAVLIASRPVTPTTVKPLLPAKESR